MALVVVPAKPLARAKARLAPALSPAERRALCLAMLGDVCTAAVEAAIGPVVIVASDAEAGAVARKAGADVVPDPTPDAGLNASLRAAISPDVDGVLIVSSDLPACTPADVAAMAGFAGVRLATDQAGTGTNALWRKPPDAIDLSFGDDSARRHHRAAAAAGIAFELIRRDGLAFDLDRPEQLEIAWEREVGQRTRAALAAMGFPGRNPAL